MLFVVDMQNDFINQEKGKMFVKDADKLVPSIIHRIKEYERRKDIIFYTLNIHENMDDDNRSKEEKKWGQQIYTPLYDDLIKHNALRKIYYGISPEQTMEIKKRCNGEKRYTEKIEIVGVETHICVLSNAIILQNLFPNAQIIINQKLCISSDLNWHEKGLNLMKELNMEVIK